MYPNVKIEMHLLQNVAPSCLNRDENNAPKDCDFGGVRRARISSQSLKRAIREAFRNDESISAGTRTKRLRQIILDKLGSDDERAPAAVNEFVSTYFSQMDKKEGKEGLTAVLLYFGEREVDELVGIIRDELWEDLLKEAAKEKPALKLDKNIVARLKTITNAADVALFGRMLAEHPDLRVDAACQVAHAISTNRVDREFDFYTAVDDLNPAEETGAGMMGVTEYNSACFYRYALIDRAQLLKNLNGDAELADRVIRAFLQAAVTSLPTGKQNTFAAHNPPSFGLFVVRRDGCPCSLANAFAQPVHIVLDEDEDIIGRSIDALGRYYAEHKKVYGSDDIRGESLFHLGQENRLNGLKVLDAGSVKAAIDRAMDTVGAAAREE